MKKDSFKKLDLLAGEELPLCPLCGAQTELWEIERIGGFHKAVCCSNSGEDSGDECPFFMHPQCLEEPTRRAAIETFKDKAMPDPGYWVHWDEILEAMKAAFGENVAYDNSPMELILQLINERDEALSK